MASNPMQRKTRNSFLLGIVVTLLITGVVIAFLILQWSETQKKLQAEIDAKMQVYTLTQDVKAGQIITQDMIQQQYIHRDSIPVGATEISATEVDSWFLQTKEGETICSDKWGLYIDRSAIDGEEPIADTIIEIFENTNNAFFDTNGNKVEIGDKYVVAGEITEKVDSVKDTEKDEFGMFFVDKQGNDKIVRVYQEPITGEFYILKIDINALNSNVDKVRVKEYLDIKNVPVLAKVDMNANTVITKHLIVQSDENITKDTRQVQYNMITLPIDLMTNDYVDIRLKIPSGQNYIVISKAQVEIPMNADNSYVADTIKVNLREDEILAMSSAIVEAYGIKGAELYVTKYVDPAMQEAAIPDYTPNAAVTAQLDRDGDGKLDNPNILEQASAELLKRYSEAVKRVRNKYLQQTIDNLNKTEGDANTYNESISSGVQESMGTSLTTRQKYLESLGYSTGE